MKHIFVGQNIHEPLKYDENIHEIYMNQNSSFLSDGCSSNYAQKKDMFVITIIIIIKKNILKIGFSLHCRFL